MKDYDYGPAYREIYIHKKTGKIYMYIMGTDELVELELTDKYFDKEQHEDLIYLGGWDIDKMKGDESTVACSECGSVFFVKCPNEECPQSKITKKLCPVCGRKLKVKKDEESKDTNM